MDREKEQNIEYIVAILNELSPEEIENQKQRLIAYLIFLNGQKH